MVKFKVGDLAYIHDELSMDDKWRPRSSPGLTPNMIKDKGEVMTVTHITVNGNVRLDNSVFFWSPRWLETQSEHDARVLPPLGVTDIEEFERMLECTL